ncbi:hypothetical protein ACFQAT_28085 [Undibacterium arcticum]|uniref:hypothetical protein n=1 Tax=Undibacterium arcticum TaxID=1762892 RepID=UPI00360EC32F
MVHTNQWQVQLVGLVHDLVYLEQFLSQSGSAKVVKSDRDNEYLYESTKFDACPEHADVLAIAEEEIAICQAFSSLNVVCENQYVAALCIGETQPADATYS